MCLALPMQVLETDAGSAWCDDRGQRRQVDVRLVEAVVPGDWLLVFHGVARERVDAARAAEVGRAVAAVEAALNGATDFDAHFADLVGREPELPEFLRPAAQPKVTS